ncbi:MAG: LacI family transcriptional regulator [Prolixibacteraceae bacterium]|jgi:LacI family transcriptional regulator|nr:LacI family transcriptional regulator [Prolixibacteraceae bacterium]
MKKNVTIKDIARIAGVHHTTVSLALRNSKALRIETKERIQGIAVEMGYRANLIAQGFRNRRSNTIGILVPSIQHHFFSKFISEISELANQADYSMMVFQSNEKQSTEKRNIEALIDNRVAGVIASVSRETTDGSFFNAFNRENIPVVFFDRVPLNAIGAKVTVNNFQGALDAVNLFIENGRKRIAFITGSSQINVYHDRLDGYKHALLQGNLPCCDKYLIEGGFLLEDGMVGAKQLLSLPERPDAILAVGDDVAIGAIKYLKSVGIKVPEDIAVIGFDNDPMGIAIEPELTTIEQPVSQIACMVLKLLLEAIDSAGEPSKEVILNASILRRKSC